MCRASINSMHNMLVAKAGRNYYINKWKEAQKTVRTNVKDQVGFAVRGMGRRGWGWGRGIRN